VLKCVLKSQLHRGTEGGALASQCFCETHRGALCAGVQWELTVMCTVTCSCWKCPVAFGCAVRIKCLLCPLCLPLTVIAEQRKVSGFYAEGALSSLWAFVLWEA
jgi:hypothetical protein